MTSHKKYLIVSNGMGKRENGRFLTAQVPGEVCLEMVEALANAHWKMKRPGIIHTGIILPEGLFRFFWTGLRGLVRLVRCCGKHGGNWWRCSAMFIPTMASSIGAPPMPVESSRCHACPQCKELQRFPLGWTACGSCASCLCPSLQHKAWSSWVQSARNV